VTHDQSEAMVISDRVAVLDQGRVAQIGTAEELFERPRTRFVAEFIGKTNLIEGTAERSDTFVRGPLRLRVLDANLTPGPVVLSIRPHQIALGPASLAPPSSAGENVLRATVRRASYLGDAVDYQVQLDGGDLVLRVAGPITRRFRPGDAVTLTVLQCSAVRL
jgi:ABC-type Fe3+/spermidine/putrescine transport system ATPase subunit